MRACVKFLFVLLAMAPLAARADMPGKHPAYLHALTDLRHARAHLERPANVMTKWDEKVAIHAIDDAINEIKKAAIDDGKPLSDHPPVDAKLDWPGRLHRSLELLHKAKKDIDEEEDNKGAHELRQKANGHIDRAINFVEQGIANK
jgi:hypothetical protein